MSVRYGGDEEARLAALASYPVDDPELQRELQEIARRAVALCGTPVGGVVLLERDRIRIIGPVGIQPPPLPRQSTITEYSTFQDSLFIVPNTLEDPRFANSAIVIGPLRTRFYASVPLITPQGHRIGVFALLDAVPRDLTEAQRAALIGLGREAMEVLEKHRLDGDSKDAAASSSVPLFAGIAAMAIVMILTIAIAISVDRRRDAQMHNSTDQAAVVVAALLGDCVAAIERARAAATRARGELGRGSKCPLAFLPIDQLSPANAAKVNWIVAPREPHTDVVTVAAPLRATTAQVRDNGRVGFTPEDSWLGGPRKMPLMVAAIYDRVLLPDVTATERRNATTGWLLIPIDLESAMAAVTAGDVTVAVYDGRHSLRRRLLLHGAPADNASSLSSERSIQVLGETWIVDARPSQNAAALTSRIPLILIAGLLLALAAAFATHRVATLRLTRSSMP